jgi:hypothetical protein
MFGSRSCACLLSISRACLSVLVLGSLCACESSDGGQNNPGVFGQGGNVTSLGGSSGATTVPGLGGTMGQGGGLTGSGGTASRGGAPGSGGAGTGGATVVQSPDECLDSSTFVGAMGTAFVTTAIPTDSAKTYGIMTNWWSEGKFDGQTISINGLGFTIGNPKNMSTDPGKNEPIGFPAFFIGNYQGVPTQQSNLPKSVSSLTAATGTAIPTVFQSNATSLNTSDFNATYDVWFTSSSALLSDTATDPGSGGAFLMVWMYDPSNRQPRGSNQAPGHKVLGVDGNWDVWVDRSNPACVSYVSSSARSSLTFDLNDFIKDAVSNSYGVTSSMYLNVVFAGFEVWSGADGAKLEKFCVKVN